MLESGGGGGGMGWMCVEGILRGDSGAIGRNERRGGEKEIMVYGTSGSLRGDNEAVGNT